MSIHSQSRHHNRGPLIAVIKIELDEQNVDRIFLHAKDDDEQLAEEFVQKHKLNPMLMKHIVQKIQMSREAVSENKCSQQPTEQNYQQFISHPSNNSFATPIQKRNSKVQSTDRQNLYDQYKQQSEKKQKNNYVTYTDTQRDYIQYKQKTPIDRLELTKSKQIPEKQRKALIESRESLSRPKDTKEENFTKNKFKNLYDVSGLKLKSSNPSIHKELQSKSFEKNTLDDCISSGSSQGLFEKELSPEKISKWTKPDNINRKTTQYDVWLQREDNKKTKDNIMQNFQNDKFFKKQKVEMFIQTPEEIKFNKEETFNPYVPKFNIQNFKNPLPFQSHIANQTKFSSIDRQEQGELTEQNYISFNVPFNEQAFQIPEKQLNNFYQQSIKNADVLFDDNKTIKYNKNIESSIKKVGSIRSNQKTLSQITQKNNNFFNRPSENNSVASINPNDMQITKRQQKMFMNIKQIHKVKGQQQNYYQNEELTSRPSRVKFYNKQEMKSLRQSTMSRSISRSQLSKINKQVTNRLYNEAEIKKKYLNQLKIRAKNIKDEENQELQELTLKPEINQLSKALAQNRIRQNKRLQDHLIEQGKLSQMKRQDMVKFQVRKQLQQCSFKPQINDQSNRLSALHRSKSRSRMSNLSEVKRSAKKNNQNNPAKFRPQINKISSELAKNKGSFEQRQKAFLEEKNNRLFKKQQEQRMRQKTDSASGQKLFHPQLSKNTIKIAQQGLKNRQNTQSIHSYLFELSKYPREQPKIDPKPAINPASQKIIQQLHQKRINWLFLQLDNDEDGVISSRKICIDQIPTEILQIIAPVLYEMEELNTELNLQDFRNALKNLTKSLDPYQKSILYNYSCSIRAIRN